MLQRFKKHDLPIRCFSAATPHKLGYERVKTWASGESFYGHQLLSIEAWESLQPESKMFAQQSNHKSIGNHHPPFQPAIVCWIIGLPKSIKKAHPCPSSISGLRIFGDHQNKGRFFSDWNNISRYLEYWNRSFTCQCQKQNHAWLLALWFCGFHVLFLGQLMPTLEASPNWPVKHQIQSLDAQMHNKTSWFKKIKTRTMQFRSLSVMLSKSWWCFRRTENNNSSWAFSTPISQLLVFAMFRLFRLLLLCLLLTNGNSLEKKHEQNTPTIRANQSILYKKKH